MQKKIFKKMLILHEIKSTYCLPFKDHSAECADVCLYILIILHNI